MNHRHRLFFQSTCIIVPLALLAVLATWQLNDARKVAEVDSQNEIERYIKGLERRLDEAFELLIDQSIHWSEGSIDRQLYPLTPDQTHQNDLKYHERFLELVNNRSKLRDELPDLSEGVTPSGLPLEPIIRWRLIELGQDDQESLTTFLRCITQDHPSIITSILLSNASSILDKDDLQLRLAISSWKDSEYLRSIIRPEGDIFPFTENQWINDAQEFWVDTRRGGMTFVSKVELTKLSTEVLDLEGRPEYLDTTIKLISSSSIHPFKIEFFITNDELIYARYRKQRSRQLLLIGISSFIAVIGWVALYRSHRKQIEMSEMKSNFVSSVSHELRAPTASIRLLTERLRSGKVKDDLKRNEYYEFIESESLRLSNLVENVLDFSRIEKGIKQYSFDDIDVASLTRDVVAVMKYRATENGISISTEILDKEVPIQADADEIYGALVNLIDNAIKFSTNGDAVLVGLKTGSDNGNSIPMIKLWVQDNGPGIPLVEQEKIFDRFYRSGSELTRKTQGAGIGLSIVKHIVEGHGGEITLECPKGGGAVFTIILPCSQSHD